MASHTLVNEINLSFATSGSIVEIGAARESSGPDSSTFFLCQLAKQLDAEFYSVDFSEQSWKLAAEVAGDCAFLSDGVEFLRMYPKLSQRRISILYLDNFDIIYNDLHKQSLMRRVGNVYDDRNEQLTNERSAAVHLEQIETAMPLLAEKNIVVIDDTQLREEGWWGKGAAAVPFLLNSGYSILVQTNDGVLLANRAYTE